MSAVEEVSKIVENVLSDAKIAKNDVFSIVSEGAKWGIDIKDIEDE